MANNKSQAGTALGKLKDDGRVLGYGTTSILSARVAVLSLRQCERKDTGCRDWRPSHVAVLCGSLRHGVSRVWL